MDVVVTKSRIHGKGVFASRNFKRGELVVDYGLSKVLTKSEVDELPLNDKQFVERRKDGKFFFHHSPARFVNHSCESNTIATDSGNVAVKDIQEGEEITSSYSDGVTGINVPCKCGSRNCRRILKI